MLIAPIADLPSVRSKSATRSKKPSGPVIRRDDSAAVRRASQRGAVVAGAVYSSATSPLRVVRVLPARGAATDGRGHFEAIKAAACHRFGRAQRAALLRAATVRPGARRWAAAAKDVRITDRRRSDRGQRVTRSAHRQGPDHRAPRFDIVQGCDSAQRLMRIRAFAPKRLDQSFMRFRAVRDGIATRLTTFTLRRDVVGGRSDSAAVLPDGSLSLHPSTPRPERAQHRSHERIESLHHLDTVPAGTLGSSSRTSPVPVGIDFCPSAEPFEAGLFERANTPARSNSTRRAAP